MTKILASIKNVHEAEIISKFNFDIVDIKNVDDGALGYVGDGTIEEIIKIFSNNKLSVTAGNDSSPLSKKQSKRIEFLDQLGVEYVKIGVFDTNLLQDHYNFLESVKHLTIKTVGVIFADLIDSEKEIEEILKLNYDGLMIDTASKNNQSTLDILTTDTLKFFIKTCKESDKFCGISGSLTSTRLRETLSLQPNFIGLRGALCSHSKRDNIDPVTCQSILNSFKLISQKMYQEAV
tara:strand:+ start:72 stop:776 length:705 start_codon:yes stop_codon:yes gene_type:complete